MTKKALNCHQTPFLMRGWGLGTRLYVKVCVLFCMKTFLSIHYHGDRIYRYHGNYTEHLSSVMSK